MAILSSISSKIIETIIKKRNKGFDTGTIPIYRSSKPVISVGNLTFGGSGKTPLTIAIAKELIQKGFKPGIIGKGYKRKHKDINIIHDGKNLLTDWHHAGDEMFLIAEKLNIPVVVHNKKFEAAKIIEQLDTDVTILDDGFQHRYLHRDLDFVIIDSNTINYPWFPPRGNLREPIDSLDRADLVFANEDLKIHDAFSKFEKYKPILFKQHIDNVYEIFSHQTTIVDDRPVLAFCGVANPIRFYGNILKTGAIITQFIEFKDHHNYSKRDLSKLLRLAKKLQISTLITTEKDAVKLGEFKDLFKMKNIDILALPIRYEITYGKNVFSLNIQEKIGRSK